MWWAFFIIFLLISIFSTVALFYSLKRINQYESIIMQFQQIIEYSTEQMKKVDSSGHYTSDDETGFFFEQLKTIQLMLNDLFEVAPIEEKPGGKKKE